MTLFDPLVALDFGKVLFLYKKFLLRFFIVIFIPVIWKLNKLLHLIKNDDPHGKLIINNLYSCQDSFY